MSVLARIGLDRPELRRWAWYDWAISAVQTTVMVAVFPIYYTAVAGAGLRDGVAAQWLAIANSVEIAIVALLSPVLGAMADYAASKKRFLGFFTVLGVLSCMLMFFIMRGDLLLATVLYILAMVGAQGAFVFYEALLPHLARGREMDRVSTAGYAFGYIGGGVLLALQLAWIQKPAWFGLPSGDALSEADATLPVRLALLSVGVWWAVFSIPLFRGVPEPPRLLEPDERGDDGAVRVAVRRLRETFRELRLYRQAFILLLAAILINDGIGTIQRMATAYGTELGIGRGVLISAILIVQFVGIPFSFLFGAIATRLGPKTGVFIGLGVFGITTLLGFYMRTATHFYLLAGLLGMVQGGTQALLRSLFAAVTPRHKSGEFFGLYSIFSKFAGVLGPLLFALAIQLTGSSRGAVLSILAFFVAGGLILARVDVEEGERAAEAADRATRLAPAGAL